MPSKISRLVALSDAEFAASGHSRTPTASNQRPSTFANLARIGTACVGRRRA